LRAISSVGRALDF